MFWGLVLEPGKRYSTTVEKSFHVSKAALDCSTVRNDNEILSVILETEGSEALLCNLCKQKAILQENLDLNFMTGDRLTFECRGHGRIHLSGYLLPEDDDDISGVLGDEEEESEEDEERAWTDKLELASGEKSKIDKRKNEAPPDLPAKKKKMVAGEAESDSDQDEESDLSEGLDDEDLDEDEDDEESDKDSDEESEDEDDEALTSPKEKAKQQKQGKNEMTNKQNLSTPKKSPVANGLTPKEQKNKKTPGGDKTPNSTSKQKQVLDQGVMIRDIKAGSGPPAKIGRMVSVHYIGRLKDGAKVFDKQLKGEGFKFKLGKGEVIKGWDIGVQGMKVGGKRTIHCPAEVAYGAKGVPPKIPPNSSLIFEVELLNVN